MSKLKVDEIRSADRSVSSSANITLADDGKISVPSGIDFSGQTAAPGVTVANVSEVLDHYEEGSFEPLFADAASGGNTSVLSANYKRLRYVRIGSLVHISGYVGIDTTGFSSLTGSNAVYLRGLPFTIGGNIPGSGTGYYRVPVHLGLAYGMQFSSYTHIEGDLEYGTTNIILRKNNLTNTNSSQTTPLTVSELSNNGFFTVSAQYVCQ